jgi:hypothetical protein
MSTFGVWCWFGRACVYLYVRSDAQHHLQLKQDLARLAIKTAQYTVLTKDGMIA